MTNNREGIQIDLMSDDEKEQRGVIERITKSRFFMGAVQGIDLLHSLYENRARRLNEADIAVEHFGLASGKELDSGKIRKLCGALRNALIDYSKNDVSKGNWH